MPRKQWPKILALGTSLAFAAHQARGLEPMAPGHAHAAQITQLNNGRRAVVTGNGRHGARQQAQLLLQYLDGDRALKRIPAGTDASGSGLAAPALVDIDGDGRADVAYAGDNLGNLWKFDLTGSNDQAWATAFGQHRPLFSARGPQAQGGGPRNQAQPISAAPIVRPNDRLMRLGSGGHARAAPVGGMMVFFGTGNRHAACAQRGRQQVQTLYAVLDNSRYRKQAGQALQIHPGTSDSSGCAAGPDGCVPRPTPVGTIAGNGMPLARQEITAVDHGFATINAVQELTPQTWRNYQGWYLDLPASGERLLRPAQFLGGSNILAVHTETPPGGLGSQEPCDPSRAAASAGSQFRTLINIMDGKRPSAQLVDYNGDGSYDAADRNVARAALKAGRPDALARMPEQAIRPSWRQLQ